MGQPSAVLGNNSCRHHSIIRNIPDKQSGPFQPILYPFTLHLSVTWKLFGSETQPVSQEVNQLQSIHRTLSSVFIPENPRLTNRTISVEVQRPHSFLTIWSISMLLELLNLWVWGFCRERPPGWKHDVVPLQNQKALIKGNWVIFCPESLKANSTLQLLRHPTHTFLELTGGKAHRQ